MSTPIKPLHPLVQGALIVARELEAAAWLLGGFCGLLLVGELAYLGLCALAGQPPTTNGCWGP